MSKKLCDQEPSSEVIAIKVTDGWPSINNPTFTPGAVLSFEGFFSPEEFCLRNSS